LGADESYIRRTDIIEDVGFEVDGGYGEDGRQSRGFLTLEGDFVETFQRYLENEDESDPDYGRVILRLERNEAEKLVVEISKWI